MMFICASTGMLTLARALLHSQHIKSAVVQVCACCKRPSTQLAGMICLPNSCSLTSSKSIHGRRAAVFVTAARSGTERVCATMIH
jgi:hypothetical protein